MTNTQKQRDRLSFACHGLVIEVRMLDCEVMLCITSAIYFLWQLTNSVANLNVSHPLPEQRWNVIKRLLHNIESIPRSHEHQSRIFLFLLLLTDILRDFHLRWQRHIARWISFSHTAVTRVSINRTTPWKKKNDKHINTPFLTNYYYHLQISHFWWAIFEVNLQIANCKSFDMATWLINQSCDATLINSKARDRFVLRLLSVFN